MITKPDKACIRRIRGVYAERSEVLAVRADREIPSVIVESV
jgi:hypothetical protein